MDQVQLKINDSKTEFIYFGWPSQLGKCRIDSINVNGEAIERTYNTKYLGAHLDSKLDFRQHIKVKCKAAMLNLHRIKAARKHFTRTACNRLVVSLGLSHLDYANSLLGGLPKSSINKMQAVQNMAAKITLGKGKYDNTTRCLVQLHWLPIKARIVFKILSLVHRSLHGEAPPYLESFIKYHIPTRPGLQSQQSTNRLLVPHSSKKSFAARSFSVLGPQLWNSLLDPLRRIDKYAKFIKDLKTHLFKTSYKL